MLWRVQVCSVKRPYYGKRNIFRALRLPICSVYRPNYGKRNIFHALETADMLCEAPELWKTQQLSCFGGCRYALRGARTMEIVTYSMLWRAQMCSVKHPNHGTRNIFNALETADMLCEAPEPWKT
jgi:sulfur relay (sulfurtransferase) complex TusBCD TusD component (DsrE family)